MKHLVLLAVTSLTFASAAVAEGDATKGKSVFGKCKACHSIADPEGNVLVKGGRTGPNLYGLMGRQAGSVDYRFSSALVSAGEDRLIWDEAQTAAFVADPRGFLKSLGGSNKTKMTFKLRKGGADVAAYLATFGDVPVVETVEGEADTSGETASE